MLKVYDLNVLQVGCYVYKTMNNLLPAAFTICFVLNSNVHSHETKSSSNIHVVGFSLNVGNAWHGKSVSNMLPLAVTLSTKFTVYNRCLKTLLITQY